jgi:hypothetical protein
MNKVKHLLKTTHGNIANSLNYTQFAGYYYEAPGRPLPDVRRDGFVTSFSRLSGHSAVFTVKIKRCLKV